MTVPELKCLTFIEESVMMKSLLITGMLFATSQVFAMESRVLTTEQAADTGRYCDQKTLVDIHAHAGCIDDGGKTCYISKRMQKERIAGGLFSKYNALFNAFGVTEAEMKANGNPFFFKRVSDRVAQSTCVQSLVLLALDANYKFDAAVPDYENSDFMVRNELVSENVRKYPNLLWGASVHPFRRDYAQQLEYAHKNGAVLVKLIPPIMGVRLDAEEADVKARMIDYYRLLAKYRLPLLVHLDEEGTFTKELERRLRSYVGVLGIRAALENGVTVIVAHAASRESKVTFGPSHGNTYKDVLELMKEPSYRGKLYADISALPTISTRADHMCKVARDYAGNEDRLLWGSDFPLNHWKTTSTILVGPGCGRGFMSTTAAEQTAYNQSREQWDRAILLQKNMNATDEMFNNTRKFLLERGLVDQARDGRLLIQKR